MLVQLDINTFLGNELVGYAGCGVAAVFFGSNYVVTKQVPVGDGLAFQWVRLLVWSVKRDSLVWIQREVYEFGYPLGGLCLSTYLWRTHLGP